ncbi:WbqC family protein [Algoriphagus halophilus]|uniref:WbqC-like protein family protein n=1 Tax=Algoriphagus halophilus TaxID=226505 RepID=A0A1N6H9T2_9BACT|nr:WbqC family protein [Algoriphagus halophilus]SIO16500.1 WbqC-like protein family protein [Algoriphagus halophilus]
MKRVVVDLHFIPCLEFFTAVVDADEILVSPDELYQRQSYLNRTRIRLANKVESLSIPIQGRRPRLPLNKVLIDYSQNWQKIHVRGIQSAYGKAPFFEFFFPYIEPVFEKKHASLWDLNYEMLTICLKLLRYSGKLTVCQKIDEEQVDLDLRGQIKPSGSFLERELYLPVPYAQLFGSDFEPNLSVLDLLFCMGTEAKKLLLSSVKN